MGIAFTAETPLKTAPYGISSVVSLVDDILLEKLRAHYSNLFNIPYQEIHDKIEDFRAKRITAYLNMLDKLVSEKLQEIRNSIYETGSELKKYFDMLPDGSQLRKDFMEMLQNGTLAEKTRAWLHKHIMPGTIDVNIMTKVDGTNYRDGKPLPTEYNDAHAALRGFARSNLRAAIVLSAGMNPRLYGYMENFEDFFPDSEGDIRKKVILKVSDYRSALIQGKFLAKKGIWVSEFRVESGLNCGGHAFATDGYLMGPILEEFKNSRENLTETMWSMLKTALENLGKTVPARAPELKITAQGGVGTAREHEFLMDHYGLDSIGWGTPFLLAPDVTTVDENTRKQLREAREEDLYLSGISPLGVPFNNLRGNSKDAEKEEWIKNNRPGSPCPKKFVCLNTDFGEKGICIASRQYQALKIKELETLQLPEDEYKSAYDKIVEKACICVGLGTAGYIVNDMDIKGLGPGVSVCPGPNMAYFSKPSSLPEMCDHIYGRTNIIERKDRPHVFIKELRIYANYLADRFAEHRRTLNDKQEVYLEKFRANLKEGIQYYRDLFGRFEHYFSEKKQDLLTELDHSEKMISDLSADR